MLRRARASGLTASSGYMLSSIILPSVVGWSSAKGTPLA